jgi:hypothetical protein
VAPPLKRASTWPRRTTSLDVRIHFMSAGR